MKKYLFLTLLPLIISCGGSTNHEANINVVKDYVEAVEKLDHNAMENLLADTYVGYGPSFGDTIYREAAVAGWKSNVENLYEGIKYTRSQFAGLTIADGPNKGDWVANWAELKITYKNGDMATIWVNTSYKIEQGKIVKTFAFYNEADVLEQLGYVFINPNNL
ncbi:MAG: nuclear transport factor 2 family protein [Robiginitalea sp.]|jgi:hypothetical protein